MKLTGKRADQRRNKYHMLRKAGFSSKEATFFKSRKMKDIQSLIEIKERSIKSRKEMTS